MLAICSFAKGQITGRVLENQNIPLAGVNVIWIKKGITAQTDRNGYFSISEGNSQDTLLFKYVGFDEVKITLKPEDKNLTINLYRKNNTIETVDVVHTGLYKISQERSTGSFDHINLKKLNESDGNNIINRLEGMTTSLLFDPPISRGGPAETPELRLRGLSSINGNSQPLIILDNFPYEGDISTLNTENIASITFLKDAAAASIWGARAGNGVIVITTKTAEGNKTSLNFSSSNFIKDKPDLYYNNVFIPSPDAVELEKELFNRGLYVKNDGLTFTPVVDILFAKKEGKISESEANAELEALKKYDIREQATAYLYRNSMLQQHFLDIKGGSQSFKNYFSLGLNRNYHETIGDDDRRVTLNFKNQIRLNKWMTSAVDLFFVNKKYNSSGIGFEDLAPTGKNMVHSYARLKNDDNTSSYFIRDNSMDYNLRAESSGFENWLYSPLDERELINNNGKSNDIRVSGSLDINISKNIIWYNKVLLSNVEGDQKVIYDQNSYFVRNLRNRFRQKDGSLPIPLGGIFDQGKSSSSSQYYRSQVDFNLLNNSLVGLVGAEVRQDRNESGYNQRYYGYNADIGSFSSIMDMEKSYPLNPSGSGRITNVNGLGKNYVDRFISYYTNWSYAWKRYGGASTSIRWDASNIFGVDFNKKGVPLWSVGTYANMHEILNLPSYSINSLKVRATYGVNGNVNTSLSSLPFMSYGSVSTMTGKVSGRLLSLGNPDLSWEKVTSLNLGMNLALLSNRLHITFDYFNKKSTNLLGQDYFDPTTGIINTGTFFNMDNIRNYASLSNNGFDLDIQSKNLQGNVKWNSQLLLSHVKNKVVEHYLRSNELLTNYLGTLAIPPVKGNSKDQLYAIPWNGLDNMGNPLVKNEDGLDTDYAKYFTNLKPSDLIKIGVSRPTFFGSLRNSIAYRDFSMSFSILFKMGHVVRRNTINYATLFGRGYVTHNDYLLRWQKEGDENITSVPSMPAVNNARRDQAYMFSEAVYESGSNIRFNDIKFSYNFPTIKGIGNLNMYFYGKDLGLLWKKSTYDFDPSVNALYPNPKQYAFGVQLQF